MVLTPMVIPSGSGWGLGFILEVPGCMLHPFTVPFGATDVTVIGAIPGDVPDEGARNHPLVLNTVGPAQIGLFVDKLPPPT